MNNAIGQMLSLYQIRNQKDQENAVKEIIQEIVLSALSHTDFFSKAAFYGGTCLRIFHGLDRFSEDLDFALLEKDNSFDLKAYFPALKKELNSYGMEMEIVNKNKESVVQSAFLKGNTTTLFMYFFPNSENNRRILSNQSIKVKFEIDTDNVSGGIVENKYRLLPAPFQVKIFDESTLFSGKIHAIICRTYKNRIKGRDYYDYLFYCSKKTKINLMYLENKLKNTGIISQDHKLSMGEVKEMLRDKFENIDYALAKDDVKNFIENTEKIEIWCPELFISTLDGLSAG